MLNGVIDGKAKSYKHFIINKRIIKIVDRNFTVVEYIVNCQANNKQIHLDIELQLVQHNNFTVNQQIPTVKQESISYKFMLSNSRNIIKL